MDYPAHMYSKDGQAQIVRNDSEMAAAKKAGFTSATPVGRWNGGTLEGPLAKGEADDRT